jgi:hypothetical protein
VNHRLRGVALACAVLGFLNASVWALVMPSLHVPDEPQHFAYVQLLAETGRVPQPRAGNVFSLEESVAFSGVDFNAVVGNARTGRPPWSADQDRALERALHRPLGRVGDGASSSVANNPPLYYAVEAVSYRLANGGDFWTRLLAGRLTSAALTGLATMFVFLFLAELLPGRRVEQCVGALAAGLAPLTGFIGGGVNNDVGLMVLSAALFWALARAFRRGLGLRDGLLVGAIYGLALITKANAIGLAPALGVAAGVLLARQWRTERRAAAIHGVLCAAGLITAMVGAYVVLNRVVWDRPLWVGQVGVSGVGGAPARGSLADMLSYAWQFYLPRLPGMHYDLPGSYPLVEVWFKGWIGRFGWLDYTFPTWVWEPAAAIWSLLVAGAAFGLWRERTAVLRRRGELCAYAAGLAGLLALIAVQGYGYRVTTGFVFEQARYLLPLLALYGALVAVAVGALGRARAPVLGALVVSLTLAHGLAALALTLGRYYA